MQGARGQIHKIDDHDSNTRDDRGYDSDDDFHSEDSHPEAEASFSTYDVESEEPEKSWSFGALLGALSGTIAGFFLAGAFDLAVVAFVALAVGGILGWLARGIAE